MSKIDSSARFSVYGMLRTSASALVLGALALSAPAYAQDSDEAADDEIVVTGIRASLRSAQDIKRNAEQIVDSITAVDIGALPDRSVTEALQRVPGVAISRTPAARDPVRFAAEGSGVVVRGMTQVRGEFNGRDSFTANNGRGLSFEDVPPELMAGVDVFKNPSADMIEGGIGGLVNLRTRMPFDNPGQVIAFSVDGSYGDFREEWSPSGSVLYSNRWHTPAGEIGILLDAAYSELATRTDTLSLAPYWERSAANGNLITGQDPADIFYTPGAISWRALDWDRTREGYAAALQWAPLSDLELYFQYTRSAATQESNERAAWSNVNGAGVQPGALDDDGNVVSGDIDDWEFDANNVFTFGQVIGGDVPTPTFVTDAFGFGVDTRWAVRDSVTTDYALGLKWNPTDKFGLLIDAQYVEATTDSIDFTVFNRIDFPEFTMDLRGSIPGISLGGVDATDPANYYWYAAMDHHDDNDADQFALRADAIYEFDDDAWLESFRVGVRHTDRDLVNRETNWNWAVVSEWWSGNRVGMDGNLYDGAGVDVGDLPVAATNSHLYTFPNFLQGEANLPSQLVFPNTELVQQGVGAVGQPGGAFTCPNPDDTGAYAFIHQLQCAVGTQWGWQPFNGDYQNSQVVFNQDGTLSFVGGQTNTQHEATDALYALFRIGGDSFFGSGLEWDGNFGARYVRTQIRAEGLGRIGLIGVPGTPEGQAACQTADPTDGPLNANCVVPPGEYAFGNGAEFDIVTQHNYNNVLPSLNLRVHLTDELQARFAASKAISRPDFGQLQPNAAISPTYTDVIPADPLVPPYREVLEWVGYAGNPSLNPMRANQYDIALEWYFTDSGSLTGTVFYKDVRDYIASVAHQVVFTNNGQTRTVNLTIPTNIDKGIIHGFELSYQQFYDFLPAPFDGVGVQANYTFVDSMGGANTSGSPYDTTQISNSTSNTGELPLEGLSRTSYNFAVMYEKGPLSGRLAYNWRERYLLTTSQANDNNAAWFTDYGQLDGSLLYAINDHLKVGVEAANLTADTVYIEQQDFPGQHGHTITQVYPHHWIQADTRYTFVLRGTW